MGRNSAKCLHQLDVLWVCGQPHIPVVGSNPTEVCLHVEMQRVYTCYTTEITNHCYTAKVTVFPGRRLPHSCVTAPCVSTGWPLVYVKAWDLTPFYIFRLSLPIVSCKFLFVRWSYFTNLSLLVLKVHELIPL